MQNLILIIRWYDAVTSVIIIHTCIIVCVYIVLGFGAITLILLHVIFLFINFIFQSTLEIVEKAWEYITELKAQAQTATDMSEDILSMSLNEQIIWATLKINFFSLYPKKIIFLQSSYDSVNTINKEMKIVP